MTNLRNDNFSIFKEKLSELLIMKREESQLSIRALAQNIGISQGTVFRIEKGDYKRINDRHIKLMKYLSIGIDDIIDLDKMSNDMKGYSVNKDVLNINNLNTDTIISIFTMANKLSLNLKNYIKDKPCKAQEDNNEEGYKITINVPLHIGDKILKNAEDNNHKINSIFKTFIDLYLHKPYIVNEYMEEMEYIKNLEKYKELEEKIKEYEKINGIVK